MLDKVTVIPRGPEDLSATAEAILAANPQHEAHRRWERATLDVIPLPGRAAPVRPLLHRGDWVDGRGDVWTVVTASLHEDSEDDGSTYLWHEYEVVKGKLHIG